MVNLLRRSTKNGGQPSASSIIPELLDSMGNDPYVAYPRIMKILEKINTRVYFYPRGIQWLISSSCGLFATFEMLMLSRGFSGKEILSTFFPNKDTSQNYKNDIRVACYIGAVYRIPNAEKWILDLEFLTQRHALDSVSQDNKIS